MRIRPWHPQFLLQFRAACRIVNVRCPLSSPVRLVLGVLRPRPEDAVHGHRAGLDYRAYLLPVDRLSGRGAAVADKAGNFLQRDAIVGK